MANLTNGNKIETANKNDTSVTSSLFSSKTPSSVSSGGLFNIQSTGVTDKPLFGITTQTSPTGTKTTTTSVFNTLKPDSTVSDSPLKVQPTSSLSVTKTDSISTVTSSTAASLVLTPVFGITTTASKSLFSNSNNASLFKIQPVSSTTTVSTINTMPKVTTNTTSDTEKNINKDKKLKYYAKLKGLNESVSDWIKKHVEETPLCILTPIFKDYEKYLQEITEEYESPNKNEVPKDNKGNITENSVDKPKTTTSASSVFSSTTSTSSSNLFSDQKTTESSHFSIISTVETPSKGFTSSASQNSTFTENNNKGTLFSNNAHTENLNTAATGFKFGVNPSTNETLSVDKPKGIFFGVNSSATTTTTTTTTTGNSFTFGTNTQIQTVSTNSSGFSFATNFSTTTNSPGQFSFGTGKPFSFNSNIKPPASDTKNEENEEDDEPPKVEFTPVVEENSIYDKRCKVFVKRDGNFVDRGIGTLYIKKVGETEKHQLLVRANTALGNILVNIILSSVPTERIGKNNVMLICIPTPDEKPPPTSVLIRVKTSEEADDLLETLKKYKT